MADRLHVSGLRTNRSLDRLSVDKYARSVVAFNPSREVIASLLGKAGATIPGIASLETVLSVYEHNPESIMLLARSGTTKGTCRDADDCGFVAMLPLTADGHQALFDGRLNTAAPDLKFIAPQHETPDAVYFWAIFTPPQVSGGVALVMERLSSRKFSAAPLYCKAAHEQARRYFLTMGFKEGATLDGRKERDLMFYQRDLPEVVPHRPVPARRAPLYDSFDISSSPSGNVGIKVVHTLDELQKVLAIRSATYLAEQDMPYQEDADGNDFSATHLLGFIGREPAGCLRIRYFADFAKLERLAVLRRFRKSKVAFQLIRAGIEFARHKGYRHLYGQVEPDLVPIWQRFGFQPRAGEGIRYLTNRTYVEGDLFMEPVEDRLTADSGALVLLRPEGQWSRPGVLEQGA